MNSLVSIAQEKVKLWEMIESSGGELSEPMEQWLNEVEKNLSTKVDVYKVVQDDLEHEVERLKAEADKLRDAARKLESTIDHMKTRIKSVISSLNSQEIRGNVYRYRMNETQPALRINEKLLPPEYYIVKTTTEPDRARVKDLLIHGNVIPGAKLEQCFSLRTYINKGNVK